MKRNDRIRIILGPYHSNEAVVVRKVAGANDAWFVEIEGLEGLCMVYGNEVKK